MTDLFEEHNAQLFSGSERRSESYYDILEVASDASRMQIREAYIRLKNTFSGNNQVLYSLISEEEARRSLEQLEEAYRILDDEMLRRDYDRALRESKGKVGRVDVDQGGSIDPFASTDSVNKVGATGRPHELAFLHTPAQTPPKVSSRGDRPATTDGADFWADVAESNIKSATGRKEQSGFAKAKRFASKAFDAELQERVRSYIDGYEVYDGDFLAGLREIFGISQNEIQEKTKISYQYIKALEGNDIVNLPSLVYVKGFLKMYLQYLGVQKEAAEIIDSYLKSIERCRKENSSL